MNMCWLQTSMCSQVSSKLTLTFRLIYSSVILGLSGNHFLGGFQTKQAVSWPIAWAQNTAT